MEGGPAGAWYQLCPRHRCLARAGLWFGAPFQGEFGELTAEGEADEQRKALTGVL